MPEVILPCRASMNDAELLKLKHRFDDVCQSSTTPELFELCRAGSHLVDSIRTLPRMSALIAWQFQAAGAALENQRLRDRVEAWEWLDEVETLYGNLGWNFDRKQCAIDELYATLVAARAAIGGIQ